MQKTVDSIPKAIDYIQDHTAIGEKRPAYYHEKTVDEVDEGWNGDTLRDEDHVFVIDTKTGDVATVASADYQLVQHDEFFPPALRAANDVLENIHSVKIRDNGPRVDVEVLPEKPVTTNSEDFRVGVRYSNSFDKSIRATSSPYLIRLVCENGMICKQAFDRRAWRHYGHNVQLEQLTEDTSRILENTVETVPQLVTDAVSRIIDEEPLAREELDAAGFGSSYRDEIIEHGNWQRNAHAWGLYNDCTNVIEHGHSDVSENHRETLHRRAEKILTGATVNPN